MATLCRTKEVLGHSKIDIVASSVPTPFPSEALRQLGQDDVLEKLANEAVSEAEESMLPDRASSPTLQQNDSSGEGINDIMPTIAYVQKSCLTTLNDLLAAPTGWSPIIPERRHSLPSTRLDTTSATEIGESTTSALHTLVSNLRNLDSGDNMMEVHRSDKESDLIRELDVQIQSLAPSLPPADADLARALVSLIIHFNRLAEIHSLSSGPHSVLPPSSSLFPIAPAETDDLFNTLKRHLSDLQLERLSKPENLRPGYPPVLAVESALLWSRIDEQLEDVVSMCRERTECLPRFPTCDHLPPQYDQEDFAYDTPPEYEPDADVHIADSKAALSSLSNLAVAGSSEKMRMDLEAVTMAIDRLYRVAPQLHDQRVELKTSKVEQMEKARLEGSRFTSIPAGKQKQQDFAELENILELLGKASSRKLADQTVFIDAGMGSRLEKSHTRDKEKRDAFVEQLLQHSNAGRLHDQDAVLQPNKSKDPNALLTLPEFIRESIPPSSKLADPHALLSLPEFVKEPVPEDLAKSPMIHRLKSKGKLRGRSLSAPPLSWLRPSLSKSSSSDLKLSKCRRPSTSRSPELIMSSFSVHYVAENHENLQHILLFLSASGITPGIDLEAEVFSTCSDGEYLIVKSGTHTSAPLSLPGRTSAGKKAIRVQGRHYEIKFSTSPPSRDAHPPPDPVPLMNAPQLSTANPTSFICASCSLPLVQSAAISQYRDLPSEHWEELVEAWMCHADQTLHAQVAKHGGGFWPEVGQALVGGSYILFEQSSVVKSNLRPAEHPRTGTDWRLVRCLCGAVTGRCQESYSADRAQSTVYRLLKYAIRPVSQTTELSKLPLSAFIVEDMMEFVLAHATYRFVILDEEHERPRLLMWLFKPSIRLAYTTPTAYALPQAGCIHAAKVLYKIIGPSISPGDLKSVLDKYPGFPQAEHLYYPSSVCRRLAGALKESNTAYPEGMRSMTGLDVGWLARA